MALVIKNKIETSIAPDYTDVSLAPATLIDRQVEPSFREGSTPSFFEAYGAARRSETALGSAVNYAIDSYNDVSDDER